MRLTETQRKQVRTANLRLAQRCLICAGNADPTLHTDPQWTRSLCNCTIVLTRAIQSDHIDTFMEGLGI